jgi:DNA-binding response OmpR family regulator
MRIAVLDDDADQLEFLSGLMTGAGYSCALFTTAEQFISVSRRENFDLLVVDWGLPGLSGLQLTSWVRENAGEQIPILMLTCRADASDIVEGLNAGADDYIVKPLQPGVLMARIRALLRRAWAHPPTGSVISIEGFQFDTSAETVRVDGEAVVLTSKEFGLALLMFQNLHRALSRGYVLEAVWGRNPELPTRTLDMHISRIRSKLGLRPERGYRLAPVYSYGYRLERLESATGVSE